ncbi:MAG: hypothetical protein ACC682_02530 [Gemmatimonadota bacterium]
MDELGSNDDELFSMDDLEKDLKKGRGGRRLPWFAVGLILGIAGTIFVPGLLAPYLPGLFRGDPEILSGPVLAKERDGDRLLLTIQTEPGALIASFSERVAEIALLVDRGDTVTIAVDDYDPFIEDPDFEGVRKATAGATDGDRADDEGAAANGTPAAGEDADNDDAADETDIDIGGEAVDSTAKGEPPKLDTSGVARLLPTA